MFDGDVDGDGGLSRSGRGDDQRVVTDNRVFHLQFQGEFLKIYF